MIKQHHEYSMYVIRSAAWLCQHSDLPLWLKADVINKHIASITIHIKMTIFTVYYTCLMVLYCTFIVRILQIRH